MRSEIYIWTRATLNWADEEEFLAQLDPVFRPHVDLWNATFNIPFHVFRHRVREIAQLNHSRVESCAFASWDEIPNGALVVPVDDDDWLAPDLGDVLAREYDPRAIGYHWIRTTIEVPLDLAHRVGLARRRVFPRTRPGYFVSTNNYALFKEHGMRRLLESHGAASDWFLAHRDRGVKRIGRHLSVMNRTLASQTSLRQRRSGKPPISRRTLIRKFHAYKSLYRELDRRATRSRLRRRRRAGAVYGNPRASELDWCRPYVARMAALMEELTLSGTSNSIRNSAVNTRARSPDV